MKVSSIKAAACVLVLSGGLDIATTVASAQDDIRDFVVRDWDQYPAEDKAARLSAELRATDSEARALALAGLLRLGLENIDIARERFELREVEILFDDEDPEVVRNAMSAYVMLSTDDQQAESTIVARAKAGDSALDDSDYFRYLRPNGISSNDARDWLLELALGPTSDTSFSAARALISGMESPPESLLPRVMELIASDEYFCHAGLTQHVPRFGTSARQYLDQMQLLRQDLLNRVGTTNNKRPDGSRLRGNDVDLMEQAIAEIQSL